MKLIFFKKKFIQLRLIVAILFSIIFIVFGYRYNSFKKIRFYLDYTTNSLYFLKNYLNELFNDFSYFFVKKKQLIKENDFLKREIVLRKFDNLLFEHIKKENESLRKFFNSPLRKNKNVMMTNVISVIDNKYHDQIIIDKGLNNGVYVGQPVINQDGIVGQVISVNKFSSRVLLICDVIHSLPVKLLRNGIRVIAGGIGCNYDLELKLIPDNFDVKIGDEVVTSGIGNVYPEGYPVAVISSIVQSNDSCLVVRARHYINLKKLYYLLLLW